MSRDIWSCWRCGKCCSLFVGSGAKINLREYHLLEEEFQRQGLDNSALEQIKRLLSLPVTGESPPKRCIFFIDTAICSIYNKRPAICREYPIIVIKTNEFITFHISTDCPRGEEIAQAMKKNLPAWAKKLVGNKRYQIIISSFFEKAMSSFLGEES